MTFSIVGRDPSTGSLGIAVATKFLAVGAGVPHARHSVAAVAIQAEHHPHYGTQLIDLLTAGSSAKDALQVVLADDPRRSLRQIGIVDQQGDAVSFTGEDCGYWAGGVAQTNVAAQGNMLVNEATVTRMVDYFLTSQEDLAYRLLGALTAGDRAGGDSRGKQSVALLVVSPPQGETLYSDGRMSLRVDDHPEPFSEMYRLLGVRERIFGEFSEEHAVTMGPKEAKQVQDSLFRLGYYEGPLHGTYDPLTQEALRRFCYRENLRKRMTPDGRMDQVVFDYLVHRARSL